MRMYLQNERYSGFYQFNVRGKTFNAFHSNTGIFLQTNNRDVMWLRFYFRLAVHISIILAQACFMSYITAVGPRLSSLL